MSEYALMPGRYPGVVKSYNPARRTCRVEIPGLTDGGDVLPEAEIEYAVGDRSAGGGTKTEVEILPGDPVWLSFIGGDARYPIITGFRNPQAGNDVDWRRWHHKNMELLADALMKLIAGGDVLIQSGSKVTIRAPEILLDGAQSTSTGKHTVQGLLTWQAGASGTGGAGGNSISGGMTVSGGDVVVEGIGVKAHHHTAQGASAPTTPAQAA